MKILETFDFYDIWRIRNPKTKSCTFRQKHFSGVIQFRLDYIFISNSLQEIISNVNILNAFSTDHYPVFCSLIKSLKYSKGPGLWKFNNSLICNNDFVEEMKLFIHNTKLFLEQNISFSNSKIFSYFRIRKRNILF